MFFFLASLLILTGWVNVYLKRDNYLILLISVELIFLGLVILAFSISFLHSDSLGIILGLFIIVTAAIESAIGLTIIVLLQRSSKGLLIGLILQSP